MSKDRFKLIPAVYLLLQHDNKILLARRANTGYQDGKYSLPAGHLDGDELATTGIIREAKEEIGIDLLPEDVSLVHTCHRLTRSQANQERIDLFFSARKWQGEICNAEPEKCSDVSWFPIDELPDNMLPLVKRVIEDVSKGIIFSEYVDEPL